MSWLRLVTAPERSFALALQPHSSSSSIFSRLLQREASLWPPSDAVVWASGLHVEEPADEPDLPPRLERGATTGRCLLEDVSFHVGAGELLAVRIAPDAGELLLSTLAGLCPPRVGELRVEGPVVLVSALGSGLSLRRYLRV